MQIETEECAYACCVLITTQIFRLLRLLRLYTLYKQYETRRQIRAALHQAGHTDIEEEDLSLIELEIMQDQNKETRVGQKLEGRCHG